MLMVIKMFMESRQDDATSLNKSRTTLVENWSRNRTIIVSN